jgi:hypothetical protein
VVPAVLAASPSPATVESSGAPPGAPPGPPRGVQAWLDAEIGPPDAPPGGVLEAGFSFWNTQLHEFFSMGGIYVRLHPKAGDAHATEARLDEDFPGHVLARLVVPQGGAGDIEVGIRETACTDPGGCADQEARFEIAGLGPPPEATPETLVQASIRPLVRDTVAGRTFPVTVDVTPRGLWPLESVALQEHLEVVARRPAGPEVASGELRQDSGPGSPYSGRLTIPEAGEVEIAVAVPLDGGGSRVIDGSAVQAVVIEGGSGAGTPGNGAAQPAGPLPTGAGAGTPPTTEGEIPTVLWTAGIGALIVAGLFGLSRLLRDL